VDVIFACKRFSAAFVALAAAVAITGCATTESNRVIEAKTVRTHNTSYNGPRYAVVVANFQNRSAYQRGLFSSGDDRLGSQAKTILKTHLQQTNRFDVYDRDNMVQIAEESRIRGLVDVRTSRVVYSAQGAGEYELSNREVVGFGGTAGYDATLNAKVLNLAITEAVNGLVDGLERGAWAASRE